MSCKILGESNKKKPRHVNGTPKRRTAIKDQKTSKMVSNKQPGSFLFLLETLETETKTKTNKYNKTVLKSKMSIKI